MRYAKTPRMPRPAEAGNFLAYPLGTFAKPERAPELLSLFLSLLHKARPSTRSRTHNHAMHTRDRPRRMMHTHGRPFPTEYHHSKPPTPCSRSKSRSHHPYHPSCSCAARRLCRSARIPPRSFFLPDYTYKLRHKLVTFLGIPITHQSPQERNDLLGPPPWSSEEQVGKAGRRV